MSGTERERYSYPQESRRSTRSLLRSRHRNVAGTWKIEKGCPHPLTEPVVFYAERPAPALAHRPASGRKHERSPERRARRQQSRAQHSTSLAVRARIVRSA